MSLLITDVGRLLYIDGIGGFIYVFLYETADIKGCLCPGLFKWTRGLEKGCTTLRPPPKYQTVVPLAFHSKQENLLLDLPNF